MRVTRMRLRQGAAQALLLLVLCSPLPLAAVEAKETAQGKQWRVTYMEGPMTVTRGRKRTVRPLTRGSRITVTVGQIGIVFAAKKTVVLSIPVADVAEVSYDASTHRVSMAVLAALGNMASNGGSCYPPQGCGAMVLGDLMASVVTAPFKYTNHFVEIVWQEQDEEQRVVFKVGKRDYASLLAELGSVTGKEWEDLVQEEQAVHRALNRANGCQDPALAQNHLSLAPGKINSMQGELNAAAECGFRIISSEFTPSLGLIARMQKEATPPVKYEYRVLHALRTSKMQKELNEHGAQGFRLRQDSLMRGVGGVLSLVMEKSPGTAQQYNYLYYVTSRQSTLEKRIEQEHEHGYEVAAKASFNGSKILILEKLAD